MKFAKTLARVVKLASAFCGDSSWLDYKALKKALHSCKRQGPSNLAELEKSPSEIYFFEQLTTELAKVAEFYAITEEKFASRYSEVAGRCRAMLSAGLIKPAAKADLIELLSEVTRLYMALLQLENFAVMNYCGCGKILKVFFLNMLSNTCFFPHFCNEPCMCVQKHDKVSGFTTKSKFMQAYVHPQAFTHTKRLQCMLRCSENCYLLLIAALEGAGGAELPQLSGAGVGGSDTVDLADLQAANEDVALQRALEDGPKSKEKKVGGESDIPLAPMCTLSSVPPAIDSVMPRTGALGKRLRQNGVSTVDASDGTQ
jgi:hypothetical protein